ncbi:MAG: hypothetical protein P8Z75_12160 [Gammaproteobacteria bacterium]|jgi:hypothetical protein
MTETTHEALKLPPEQQEQIVEILRVWQSARDALNDDMVGRLASTLGQGLDTLDRFNRSGIADAIPDIGQFVSSGDLKRVSSLARLIAAAEDSLSDEMVARLATIITESLSVLDRLTRNGALERILDVLLQPGVQDVLVRFGDALAKANKDFDSTPHPKGGIGGLWKIGTDAGNQEAIQFMGLFGKHLRDPQ